MWKPSMVVALVTLALAGCGSANDEDTEASTGELGARAFRARSTAYYPSNSALEGGFKDRLGKPLRTLQQYLDGDADYVSVAMDSTAFPYGTKLRIPSLDAKYGTAIEFRVVDTGGAFRGRGTSRIDICVKNYSASIDPSVNRTLDIQVGGPASPSSPTPPSTSTPAPAPPSGEGPACSNDGMCNPGSTGAGKICTAGRCVAGCRADWQCPGNTTCVSGQCE